MHRQIHAHDTGGLIPKNSFGFINLCDKAWQVGFTCRLTNPEGVESRTQLWDPPLRLHNASRSVQGAGGESGFDSPFTLC